MNGPRSPSLLVYLMTIFIVLAFLLAFTLVVTAGPFSDPSDNLNVNTATMRDNAPGSSSQCLAGDENSVQETCPENLNSSIFWDGF